MFDDWYADLTMNPGRDLGHAGSTPGETWDSIYASGRSARYWPSEDVIRFCVRRFYTPRLELFTVDGVLPEPPLKHCVLEAGCGNGANLWYLASVFGHTYGVDASLHAVVAAGDLARLHGKFDHVHIVQGDIRSARSALSQLNAAAGRADNLVDCIIDCRSSQHLRWSEHAATYRGYLDLLRPGGWLFLLHLDDYTSDASMPENWPYRLGDSYEDGSRWTFSNIAAGVYPDNGLVCMPPSDRLASCARDVGFQVERVETISRQCCYGRQDRVLMTSHVAIDACKPERS